MKFKKLQKMAHIRYKNDNVVDKSKVTLAYLAEYGYGYIDLDTDLKDALLRELSAWAYNNGCTDKEIRLILEENYEEVL